MEERPGEVEPFFRLADVSFGFGHLALSRLQLLPYGGLLLFEDIERDRPRIGEMLLDELVSTGSEALDLAAVTLGFALPMPGREPEQLDQPGRQRVDALGVELDLFEVVLRDVVLDEVGGQVRQLAAVAVVAPGADEVVVLAAAPAGALRELQPAAAKPTEHGALEVVLVNPLVLACLRASAEALLDSLEEVRRDQLRMVALVLDAAELDDADVVGVAQDALERGQSDHVAVRVSLGRSAAQAAFVEFFDECPHRPFSAVVGLERPGDVRRPLGVELDVADVVRAVPAALVEIAEASPEGRAAHLGLLDAAVGDLLCEVARIEGVDRGEDAVQQHPLRAVVDVLGHRDELGAGGLDVGVGLEVGQLIAGEALKLVDDHVADVAALLEGVEKFAQRAVEAAAC